jgi:hypothetical protein
MGITITLVSPVIPALEATSFTAVLVAVALFSAGVQSVQVLVQTIMLSTTPQQPAGLTPPL